MRLHNRTIGVLAVYITGGSGGSSGPSGGPFPYRSSSYLSRFFSDCALAYTHVGSTRVSWVEWVLNEINGMPSEDPRLPARAMMDVISELLDTAHFASDFERHGAINLVTTAVKRDGLTIVVDETGTRACTRNWRASAVSGAWKAGLHRGGAGGTGVIGGVFGQCFRRFTEELLVPLFRALGFTRIALAGHRDKSLEFGKDLWMKLRLPFGAWIYFAAQVKRDRIDAAGSGRGSNVATVLDQVRMMIDHPVFDQDTNRTVLLDHALIIASGEITKAARDYIVRQLDSAKRRHIIFIDKTDLLDLCLDVSLPVPKLV